MLPPTGVELGLQRINLRKEAPPPAPTAVANITAPILSEIARRWAAGEGEPPRLLICFRMLAKQRREGRSPSAWSSELLSKLDPGLGFVIDRTRARCKQMGGAMKGSGSVGHESAEPDVAQAKGRFRRSALLGALASALVLVLFAPSASADDQFWLKNSSESKLTGQSDWDSNAYNDCVSGPFPSEDMTNFTFNPGDVGWVVLDRAVWSGLSNCLGTIPMQHGPIVGFDNVQWHWSPDDPLIGASHLSCSVFGSDLGLVVASVDGLTCTFSEQAPISGGTFVSSAAALRGRNAVFAVQHFPGSAETRGAARAVGADRPRGRYKLIVRKGSRVHGRKKVTIVSGRERRVRVPLSRALRRQIDKRGAGKVSVKATLKRVDGKRGTGHRTRISLIEDHPIPRCMGTLATTSAVPGQVTFGRGDFGRGDDVIDGTAGDDKIRAGAGDDLVCARGGDDRIRTGPGNDRIKAVKGRNRIKCGLGNDRVVTNKRSKVAKNCNRVIRR